MSNTLRLRVARGGSLTRPKSDWSFRPPKSRAKRAAYVSSITEDLAKVDVPPIPEEDAPQYYEPIGLTLRPSEYAMLYPEVESASA